MSTVVEPALPDETRYFREKPTKLALSQAAETEFSNARGVHDGSAEVQLNGSGLGSRVAPFSASLAYGMRPEIKPRLYFRKQ